MFCKLYLGSFFINLLHTTLCAVALAYFSQWELMALMECVQAYTVSVACPLETVLLWSSVMNAENTVHRQNSWIWALVWCGPIKRPGFLSRGMYGFSSWDGWSAAERCISAVSLVPLPLVLVLLSMREPPFLFHTPTSLTSSQCSRSSLKLMNCRDWLILFALPENFCVESKDF